MVFSSSGVISLRPIIWRLWELLSLPLLTEPERTVCSPKSAERVFAVSLPGAKPPKMVSYSDENQISIFISATTTSGYFAVTMDFTKGAKFLAGHSTFSPLGTEQRNAIICILTL